MPAKTQTRVAVGDTYLPDTRTPDFEVFSRALEVKNDGADGTRPTVLATASSTAIDLEADRFTRSALEQMKDGFEGRLIFLNHSYKVPQDVFGIVEKAELVKREGRLDLDLTIGVETNNPLAAQTLLYIQNGTRLGVSVGVIVAEAEKTDEEDDFGRKIIDITSIIPLEASIVGIPANQTAWTRTAIKSLFERGVLDLDDSDIAARPWLKMVAEAKNAGDAPYEEVGVDGKGAVGSHSPAKAPKERAWQSSSAVKRLRSWAGGPDKEDINWSKYRTGFAWFNADEAESFGSYKLPHHDIVNSTFVTVFRGAVAAAVVLQGGRGGVNIPEGDVNGTKRHIAAHYKQFDEEAPWEREKSADWLDVEREIAADLQIDLPDFASAQWPEAKAAAKPVTKDTRLWVTTDDGEVVVEITYDEEKEKIMAQQNNDDERVEAKASEEEDTSKTDDDSEDTKDGDSDEDKDEESDEKKDDDESDSDEDDESKEDNADDPDAQKDQEGEDEEGGGDDAHDANEGDGDHKEDETEPDEQKGDFEDGVAADQAVDVLIDKMYTGFRVAVSSLMDIVLNTDMSAGDREKSGAEVIDSWKEFIDKSWDEVIEEFLNDAESGKSVKEHDLDKRLHELAAAQAACSAENLSAIMGKAAEVGEAAKAHAEENATLRERVKTLEQGIEYASQVVEAVMELPLPTVTSQAAEVARSLAVKFPGLDTRVVERMAQFAPKTPGS